jgi:DNA replication protein DnaC
LPTIAAEFEKLARDAAESNQGYLDYLLRLTELEATARASNALCKRVKEAGFPTGKGLEAFDFSACPSVSKPKILELARCQWIVAKENCVLIGGVGTGKSHLAESLGRSACDQGHRVRFVTGAQLAQDLEKAQHEYRIDRLLKQLDRTDLLIVDELGYATFSRPGAELMFQVFADRYERRSLLITSNLAFSEWGQIFQGERMTAALLDRLTHHCHIFEMNGESYRFRESMKRKKTKSAT